MITCQRPRLRALTRFINASCVAVVQVNLQPRAITCPADCAAGACLGVDAFGAGLARRAVPRVTAAAHVQHHTSAEADSIAPRV